MIEGIDLSRYQGLVDFDEVRGAGAKYAYCKATEGETYVDPQFYRNAACGAHNAVWVGGYHYFSTDKDPEKQARHFAEIAEDATSLLPVCDFEAVRGVPNREACARVEAFMVATEELWAGAPMLYSYPSFLYGLRDFTGAWARWDLWIAHYTDEPVPWVPRPWNQWRIWQYDGDGGKRLPSGKDCDFNRARDLPLRNAEALLRWQ